jgi:hypothetical protein
VEAGAAAWALAFAWKSLQPLAMYVQLRFPSLGWASCLFAVGTLWDPVFVNLAGLYEDLDSLGMSAHGLGIVLHLLQALLVVVCSTMHAPQEFRV